jgi:predicted Fe-Mo cluster-binding NifX family protein
MTICIPIDEDHGLDSPVSSHFGSARCFLIVDTDTGACRAVVNEHSHAGHGQCQPLAAVRRERIEGVVVGGIGRRALERLSSDGIGVFRAGPRTVKETVAAFTAGTLARVMPDDACAGHGHGHGHGHEHRHGADASLDAARDASSHAGGRGAGRCQS